MSIIFILIETQLPENLGAVARVMMNFNQTHLRLVSPKCSPLDPKAIATAVGAEKILKEAKIYDSFEEAILDCRYLFATTAKRRDVIKSYYTPSKVTQNLANLPAPIGIIFGPERTGLTTDQIAACHAGLQIQVDSSFSSLNLSHAVGIMAYELFQHKTPSPHLWECGETQSATEEEFQLFWQHLEEKLDQTYFWRTPSKKPIMKRNLYSFFKRIPLFQQDLKTLYGLISALEKRNKNDD